MKPLALFTAGGPGSGKSVFIRELLKHLPLASLDPDDIQTELGGTDRAAQLAEAYRLLEERQAPLIAARTPLVINTTAADLQFVRDLHARLTANGYRTAMVFVRAPIDLAIARNIARGMPVAEPVLRAKHDAAEANRPSLRSLFAPHYVEIGNETAPEALAHHAARIASEL